MSEQTSDGVSKGKQGFSWRDLFNIRLSRRETAGLAFAAIAATGAAIYERSGFPNAIIEHLASTYLPHEWRGPGERQLLYPKEQLFVAQNSQLERERLKKSPVAFCLTHVGYTEYRLATNLRYIKSQGLKLSDDPTEVNMIEGMLTKKIGDYKRYLGDVERLVSFVKEKGELTIFGIEEPDFYDPSIPRDSLKPFDDAFILVTETASPAPVQNVDTTGGEFHQRVDLMSNYLRKNGVDEIWMAGEFSATDNGLACLGGMAESFTKEGFRVRGIRGCVFPEIVTKNSDHPVLKSLYADAVPLDKVLSGK